MHQTDRSIIANSKALQSHSISYRNQINSTEINQATNKHLQNTKSKQAKSNANANKLTTQTKRKQNRNK